VYRAVRLIAESIGTLSFVLYEGAEERDTHPLLNLVTRPNPRQDGTSLLEAVASHLLLAGNAYIEALVRATRASMCASFTHCGPTE
jgi:phage portal protein BeeE